MVFKRIVQSVLGIICLKSQEKYKVGALYVQGFKFSIGYNKSSSYEGHAEMVAIKNYRRKYKREPFGGTMYCTLSPCSQCARRITEFKSIYIYKYAEKQ